MSDNNDRPLVSVVTPFHNTAHYLSPCIESVLAQTYRRFEYILSDNCSTDGSVGIAERYARSDSRIRIIRQAEMLTQVQHYNIAVSEISDASWYCKIVQADDTISPDCLGEMVTAFEQSESIGLVSSYYLKGDVVHGSGFPCGTSLAPGKELVRWFMRSGIFVFGSPTTVMYRASVVRKQPFYDDSRLHEDTEKCMQILEQWDFGFVYQVLSFLRTENESISSSVRGFQPEILDRYIIVRRYATAFFEEPEAAVLRKDAKRDYYRGLAFQAIRLRESSFWAYHKSGLKTIGEKLDKGYLTLRICRILFWMGANPGIALRGLVRHLRHVTAELREHEL